LNTITAPSLKRRLASMLYEAMLVFAVLFAAVLIFSTLMEQRHALYLRGALQDWLFAVLGIYFIWFWTHGGQTLAMKTWRIRLVDINGKRVNFWRAIARYLLAWLWFVPGLALAWLLGAKTSMLILIPLANVVIWALAIYLDPQRQFLHDRLAGTRLVAVELPDKASLA
jgi:uncharacterized RDD family membrane protein YckC